MSQGSARRRFSFGNNLFTTLQVSTIGREQLPPSVLKYRKVLSCDNISESNASNCLEQMNASSVYEIFSQTLSHSASLQNQHVLAIARCFANSYTMSGIMKHDSLPLVCKYDIDTNSLIYLFPTFLSVSVPFGCGMRPRPFIN